MGTETYHIGHTSYVEMGFSSGTVGRNVMPSNKCISSQGTIQYHPHTPCLKILDPRNSWKCRGRLESEVGWVCLSLVAYLSGMLKPVFRLPCASKCPRSAIIKFLRLIHDDDPCCSCNAISGLELRILRPSDNKCHSIQYQS